MRNAIDFTSWEGLLSTLLGLAVFSLVVVGIRLLIMHTVQLRRERENRQINERLHFIGRTRNTLGVRLRVGKRKETDGEERSYNPRDCVATAQPHARTYAWFIGESGKPIDRRKSNDLNVAIGGRIPGISKVASTIAHRRSTVTITSTHMAEAIRPHIFERIVWCAESASHRAVSRTTVLALSKM